MDDTSLAEFVESVSGESHLRVEHDFGDGFVRLRTSEAERRQAAQDIRCTEHIVLEMLRNSRDAHASHVFLSMGREGDKRSITVVDDGDGIPPAMHAHVFEPRVTSKLDTSHMDAWGMHGRGMALYSISVNAEKARVAASELGLGCSMVVQTDLKRLPEKTDQSGFPTFTLADDGSVSVRGPRNVLRTACEFAIESRSTCQVYVGSCAEIAATLYEYGVSTLSAIDRAFCKDVSQVPIVKRLATAGDPASFVGIATSLGLDLSERTARRIMDGEIDGLDSILDRIVIDDGKKPRRSSRKAGRGAMRPKAVKLHKHDVEELADAVREPFADIADRYYLVGDVDPSIRVAGDRIVISLPIVPRD